ncbi:MAG: D-alanyl-D-alanine carboxypeptidase family protein [Myxococcales bacterium]|nr:D-alanyl-D-alanine carboxypeptidase family protein [Myxococcales bacterium]
MGTWRWLLILGLLAPLGCSDIETPEGDPAAEDDIDPAFFENELEFKNNGSLRTVGDLIRARACSTAPANRLSMQIAQEMACLAPAQWARIDRLPNVSFGPAAYPFLSDDAAAAFERAAATGRPISVTSTWRSVAQQHILKSWEGSCGIGVAATPGRSMHQSGLAVDTTAYADATVRNALKSAGFTWYCDQRNGGRISGCADPVHFTFYGGNDLRPLAVRAFQALWNRNKPAAERLTVDGDWGPATRRALDQAPLDGFPVVGNCGLDFGAGGGAGAVGGGSADAGGGSANPLPAPYQRAWVGDACEGDDACDFSAGSGQAFCQADHSAVNGSDGFCTLRCEGFCPDRAGEDTTFCVAAEVMGRNERAGLCTVQATANNRNCAALDGMVAMDVERYVGRSGARGATRTVCVPEQVSNDPPPVEDPDRPAPWIGHLCRDNSECGFAADGRQARCFLEHGPRTGVGFCTVDCAGYCPDRAGEAQTFCAEREAMGGQGAGGVCVSRAGAENGQCTSPAGFTPVSAARFVGNSGARVGSATVCAPVESQGGGGGEPQPEPEPEPPVPAPSADPPAACEALIEALAERYAAVCGLDADAVRQEILTNGVGGSCDRVSAIRDERALRAECLPWIESASCSALSNSLPAACREQLITGG